MESNPKFNIYPNLKKTFNICQAKIRVVSFNLFENANIEVKLFDENEKQIDARYFLIKDEEFAAWGTDDKYLVNLIKQKLQE